MDFSRLGLSAATLASAVPAVRVPTGSGQLVPACRVAHEQGAHLVALWASDERDRAGGTLVRVALQDGSGLAVLEVTVPDLPDARYGDVSAIFPAAGRMQRAAFDLVGVASEADDQRPWAWMASWPIDRYPLRRDFEASPKWEPGQEDYEFVRVAGDGVHEIPVGPVHAGIIEPGHFRFQIVGEKVLRLEERLSYTHKGIEKRFESMSLADGCRLAGRVSGDSTVAYAWAYSQALEALAGLAVPPRALWLRALALERERIANHLGDLGYLGNDGGFAFGLAQFSRLREDVVRTNLAAFGHRFMMDLVVPGGVARDLDRDHAAAMVDEAKRVAAEVATLRGIYDEHDGLQDRFRTCGRVTPELAAAPRSRRHGGAGERPGARPPLRLRRRALGRARGAQGGRDGRRRRRARRGPVRRARRVAAPGPIDRRPPARRRRPDTGSRRPAAQARTGLRRRLARAGARRPRSRPGRHDPALPPARPVVGELAGARARGDRQHRSRLPAHQQVVQPLVQRTGPLTMLRILKQIAKTGMRTEAPPAPADEMAKAARLQAEVLRTLGRALAIRQVDAGSCNGCELEIHALGNPYYNIEGMGIRFVASPRHADMLLVTGPVSKHMAIALRRTYDATPEPKLVVAVGDCGCTGGIFGESYATLGRVSNVIPVDAEVPGCPPTPTALLQGILAAITARVAAAGDGEPATPPPT